MKSTSPSSLRWALHSVAAAALLSVGAVTAMAQDQEPVSPVPAHKAVNPAAVELGKKLFFDPRLSKSGFISCNSCHNLSMGGTDNLKTSIGHNWQQGPINSPTVLNSRLNLAQFWDGRAKDLKEQAGGPIANPGEMAFTHELAVETLRSIPGYVDEFKQVFKPDTLSIDEVTTAIATFEETLVTPNARFDQWLKGDAKALTVADLNADGLPDVLVAQNNDSPAAFIRQRAASDGRLLRVRVNGGKAGSAAGARVTVRLAGGGSVTGEIAGWVEALQMMPVGSKWKLYIPQDLAYGARGAGSIPPYSALVFEVELLDIL